MISDVSARSFNITKRSLLACLVLGPSIAAGCSSSSPAESSSEGTYDSGIYISPDGAIIGDGSINRDGSTDGGSKPDASGDGGDSGVYTGPPPPPTVCDPAATFGTGSLLNISTSDDDVLDAITPDELTIVWTQGTGGSATVDYADRTSTSSSFNSPQKLGAGLYTADRVALSPDGLTLVVVNADPTTGFSELTRTARTGSGSTFGAPTLGSFSNIDSDAPAGASLGDPVIDSNDTAFYYSVYGTTSTKTIYRSLRLLPTDPWGNGGALNVAAGLQTSGSSRRRPSGISSDDRTLFFFDQVSSSERAAWLNETTGQFDSFVDLGSRLWAAPATSCSTLYYSATGTSSVDLFVATH
jgi:hypothetical protein